VCLTVAAARRHGPGARVTYIGHATTLLELDGLRLLTDPLLRNRVAHLRRYAPPPVVEGIAPDAVLVSHAHRDHLDKPSLRVVARDCPVLIPRGCARLLRGERLGHLVEVDVGTAVAIGSVTVVATRAVHDVRRDPFRRPLPALGFVAEGTSRAYFAGDTGLFPEMADMAAGLDLALLPVSGWGPRVPPDHLDGARAARAAALLRPRVAVPIHWGTFASPGARPREPEAPAREFARETARLAPEVKAQVLMPGESLQLATPEKSRQAP
jgi:L-ascorbate metabolism protein UlaG (beta-lactamase superfamily)